MEVIHSLLEYKNLKIVQDTQMFNFSLDSILLPNFIEKNKNIKSILDIGCGNAPMPLILSTLTDAKITGIEIQKDVAALAKKSVEINNLTDQINIINRDIKELYKEYESDIFDIVVCNPPFFKVAPGSHYNESDYKTIARHEVTLNLDDVMKISKKLLKNNGTLGMVHRPDRLVDILETMRKYNIEPKKIQLVYPYKNKDANILLIEGKKNGKPGLKIMDPIYSHNSDGSYTEEIKKVFK